MKKLFYFLTIILIGAAIVYYFYPEPKLPEGTQIDQLLVYKKQRKMEVYSNNKLIKTYKIAIGANPVGDKEFQGDRKTPEGMYSIYNKNPHSGYYKNLGISYPDSTDIAQAKKIGKQPGGDIKIHGIKNGLGFIRKFHLFTSTNGCIRVTDEEMEELYHTVNTGTTIKIFP